MRKRSGRYWIFAFEGYYPKGGMNDYRFSFDNVEEFEEGILEEKYENFQLLDTETNYDFQADLGDLVKWVCKNIGGETYEEMVN